MSMILQNLRSVTPGVTPEGLSPGQLCFNLADSVMFVGDGSNFQTSFDGSQNPAPIGQGWFSVPLRQDSLGQYFLVNPASYGEIPSDGEILTYSSTLGKPVWLPSAEVSSVYTTTNSLVASSPGVSLNEKISNALGVTPIEGDSVIVSGVPGDQYQGYYLFTSGSWTYAAGYAGPTAIQVPFNNFGTGLLATNVQSALAELSTSKLNNATNLPNTGEILSWGFGAPVWIPSETLFPTASNVEYDNSGTGIPYDNVQQALTYVWQGAQDALAEANSAQADATAAQVTANLALSQSNDAVDTANNAESVANNALAVASTALPKAGGTMTGDIVFSNGQPVDAGTF